MTHTSQMYIRRAICHPDDASYVHIALRIYITYITDVCMKSDMSHIPRAICEISHMMTHHMSHIALRICDISLFVYTSVMSHIALRICDISLFTYRFSNIHL